jgi:hypothetical protein
VQGDVRRGVTRESKAADVGILLLVTGRKIHNRDAGLHRPALPAKALGLGTQRAGVEGDPLRVV